MTRWLNTDNTKVYHLELIQYGPCRAVFPSQWVVTPGGHEKFSGFKEKIRKRNICKYIHFPNCRDKRTEGQYILL
jgi:hypothetical protein